MQHSGDLLKFYPNRIFNASINSNDMSLWFLMHLKVAMPICSLYYCYKAYGDSPEIVQCYSALGLTLLFAQWLSWKKIDMMTLEYGWMSDCF